MQHPAKGPVRQGTSSLQLCSDSSRPHTSSSSIRWRRPQQQQLQLRGMQDARCFAATPGVLTPKASRTYFAATPGVLTPNVHQLRPPYSLMVRALPSARHHHPVPHVRGQSHEPPRGRALTRQPIVMQAQTVIRSRSATPAREYSQPYIIHKPAALPAGAPVKYAGNPATCVYSHQPAPVVNAVKQVASPCRMRTAVAPVMLVPQTVSQATIQTTSGIAAASKAQSQPTEQGAQTKDAVSTCSMNTQTHPQDLVDTIQLSPEEFQVTFGKSTAERAVIRPSLQDQEAERQMLKQSWKEAVEELEANRKENKELQAKVSKNQAEVESALREKSRVEQELTKKAAECSERDQAYQELEKQLGEKNQDLQRVREELQQSHESSESARQEVRRSQEKVKELRLELASAEKQASARASAYTECCQQLQQEQKARHDLAVGSEVQRRQIEALHNYIFDMGRDSNLQQRDIKPLAVMKPEGIEQENLELKTKLADAQGDLHNALKQLNRLHGEEAKNMRAG
eukprot:TRINITY_DN5578_c0_g2_i4.p1 TRINITY_DN5578_c0_g2~~TRINITY_DN5578_c0_g2_i4.p1  ORF type:complete len:524 (+),score=132.95 TRINITY_DN5578_c0_g2_i4:31-1572(+)